MAPAGQERDGTGAAGTEPTSRGPRPDVLAVGRSPSWLRRGGRGPVSGSWGRSARPGTTPQGRSGVSRAGFEPAQGWLKASCPTVLGDRLIGPHPIRTGIAASQAPSAVQVTPRARRVRFRGSSGSAGPQGRPPPRRRPHHWWPRNAARTLPRSQRHRRRIPRVRFVRNQITSVLLGSQSGESESNAHREIYGLECCPYTMPRQSSEPQNTESIRFQYAGKPATGRFGFRVVAMRCMAIGTQEGGPISTCRHGSHDPERRVRAPARMLRNEN